MNLPPLQVWTFPESSFNLCITATTGNLNFYSEIIGKYRVVCGRFEFGAAIFIAWGGSLLDVLGGAMLAASCPRKKHVSKYPSMAGSRSGPPSSTKEYVWERPLRPGTPTEADEEPPLCRKVYGRLWFIEAKNYRNGTFFSFCSGRPLITPRSSLHCQLFHEWCLSPRPHIPQLFTSDIHKCIIIGSPDLIHKPTGCHLSNCSLNGGL